MRQHVRSWRKDFASPLQHAREGQRIALDDMLVKNSPTLASPLGAARPANVAMSAFGGRRHAGAERGVRI
jgi:hypothetical protein